MLKTLDELDKEATEAGVSVPVWMRNAVAKNPEYVFWGPDQDYMWKAGTGWEAPLAFASWGDCNLVLDDLNEVVHFYFGVNGDDPERVTLTLTFWLLHPRQSASRGVRIHRVAQADLRNVYRFLRRAATRNAQRFAKVPRR